MSVRVVGCLTFRFHLRVIYTEVASVVELDIVLDWIFIASGLHVDTAFMGVDWICVWNCIQGTDS